VEMHFDPYKENPKFDFLEGILVERLLNLTDKFSCLNVIELEINSIVNLKGGSCGNISVLF
jgi:hypothetical protein